MSEANVVADIIERAVEVIDSEGWHQGDYHAKSMPEWSEVPVPHCMIGGLIKGYTGRNSTTYCGGDDIHKAIRLLEQRVGRDTAYVSVPDYNDASETTWSDCRDLMLGVVKDLRNASIPEGQNLRNSAQNLEDSGV